MQPTFIQRVVEEALMGLEENTIILKESNILDFNILTLTLNDIQSI